jgi:signal transduction histidine kinase
MIIKEILKNVEFFSNLDEDQLDTVLDGFTEVSFQKGDVIFKENDPGDSFYILREGQVEILITVGDDKDQQAELRVFEPYDYFGEMSLIDNSPRSATAVAKTDIVLLKMKKQAFINICLNYPEVIFSLFRTMSCRLRNTNDQFADVVDSLLKKNKMAAIGSAASKIVHDIKTPITIIVLTAQLIEKLFPDTEKYTEKIVKQIKVMDEMIREILDFARGEQSKLDLSVTDMEHFISEIKETMLPIAEENEIELIFENTVTKPVFFDIQKIKRTVTNIIKNGIEAINQPGTIRFSSVVEDRFLVMRISDNGPGIPDNILATIFEPFVTHGKKSGTGLGLAICQKVVSDHRGKLIAKNNEDCGALFEIKLPLRPI